MLEVVSLERRRLLVQQVLAAGEIGDQDVDAGPVLVQDGPTPLDAEAVASGAAFQDIAAEPAQQVVAALATRQTIVGRRT